MLFNSYVFVLAFLPISVTGRFLISKTGKYHISNLFLLVMSLYFYAYFNIRYLPLIVGSILINYCSHLLFHISLPTFLRKCILALTVVFNIGILFYYKYADFFVSNLNLLFHSDLPLRNLLLPLGISFFTFQQMSFVIDSYSRSVPKYRFLNYALFVCYFPQLIAGPIVTYDELIPQLEDKSKHTLDWQNISKGLYLFAFGLAKKVLIADTFGNVANWGYLNIASLDSVNAILVLLAYTIQVYFDFSGYCDMATGAALLINISLPVNFNSPYKAITITDFWSRWHITLTRFFTRYVYIPMGGNRKGTLRMCLNTMLVFLFSGLWHGANWTFILWGGIHGVFMVITKLFKNTFQRIPSFLNWLITFIFVNITWVLFRANSVSDATKLLVRLTVPFSGTISSSITSCFDLPEIDYILSVLLSLDIKHQSLLLTIIAYAVVLLSTILSRNAREKVDAFTSPSIRKLIITVLLMVWCIFSFSSVTTFLYFNF